MAYLFAHFISDGPGGERIFFSVSKDGLHFTDLNKEQPVLVSEIGEKGARDPFVVKNEKTGRYYLIATDLQIAAGKGWGVAQFEGSRDILVWSSEDLVHWSEVKSHTIGVPEAGCVWAPESVYIPSEDRFFLFWASMVKQPGDENAKQRIYACYTEDFNSFTEPFLYMEDANHLIDMTIVHENDWFYRFVKDESTKNIRADRVKTLVGSEPETLESEALKTFFGVEGPECYKLSDGRWCLIVDRFAAHLGYIPLFATDLSKADFRIAEDNEYDFGKLTKRHGGVIEISDEEYDRLVEKFGM